MNKNRDIKIVATLYWDPYIQYSLTYRWKSASSLFLSSDSFAVSGATLCVFLSGINRVCPMYQICSDLVRCIGTYEVCNLTSCFICHLLYCYRSIPYTLTHPKMWFDTFYFAWLPSIKTCIYTCLRYFIRYFLTEEIFFDFALGLGKMKSFTYKFTCLLIESSFHRLAPDSTHFKLIFPPLPTCFWY